MGSSAKQGGLDPASRAAKLKIVSGNAMGALEESIQKAIAYRAYEIYQTKGRSHGHDIQDWFEAEHELLKPADVQITESAGVVSLRARVSGFQPGDVQIGVSPRRVVIWGEAGRAHMLGEIELPRTVDSTKASATLNDGVLDFRADTQTPRAR